MKKIICGLAFICSFAQARNINRDQFTCHQGSSFVEADYQLRVFINKTNPSQIILEAPNAGKDGYRSINDLFSFHLPANKIWKKVVLKYDTHKEYEDYCSANQEGNYFKALCYGRTLHFTFFATDRTEFTTDTVSQIPLDLSTYSESPPRGDKPRIHQVLVIPNNRGSYKKILLDGCEY